MSEVCLTCVKSYDSSLKSSSSLKAKMNVSNCINIKVLSAGSIKAFTSNTVPNKGLISATGKIAAKTNCSFNAISLKDKGIASIRAYTKVRNNAVGRLKSTGNIPDIRADKFACSTTDINSINNFQATEKLYPIKDLVIGYNNNYFVDKYANSGNLYSNIDEGVFINSYTKHGGSGLLISDDRSTYIHPSSVYTKGDFKYKCEVTRPLSDAKKSFLIIRAAAPVSDYASNIPPQYKIHNIKLEDPSGNLIIKYKDIILRGDADYDADYKNFVTYITSPEINNLQLRTWEDNYPFMYLTSGYSLNLDFNITCLDDPFSQGFNKGYEDTCKLDYVIGSGQNNNYLSFDGSPISTQSQGFNLNPNNSLRISAIEIANSGSYGLVRDSYLRFYSEVDSIGRRNTRSIFPVEVITSDTNLEIYPSSTSVWKSSPDSFGNYYYNTSISGSQILSSRLQDDSPTNYITLISTNPVNDSGRLTLKFSHKTPTAISSYSQGAFSFGGRNNAFDTAELQIISETDNFFVVDSIELKVIAKKATGTRNYIIDAVGYSDDKLLNITPKLGAFLQNKDSGNGNIPQISGFLPIDDLALSAETISDKSEYFEDYITNIPAGDHYKLSNLPVISGTVFQEYTIPLEIYKDNVQLGKSIDYSMSSYFENLYLDLYPIPSGASISTAYLVINYKPSNGLLLHTLGQTSDIELAHRDITLYPSNENNACIINGDSIPLSSISGIPQAYQSHSGIRSNYARRWRGVDGNIVDGPYNPNQFDLSFYNPPNDYPFLDGYFDFNTTSGNWIISNDYSSSGHYYGSETVLNNIGLRFKSQQIFPHSTTHTTIDWTQPGDELYGQISDSFNNALLLNNTNNEYINFGNLPLQSGFSIYLRFTPGYDYDFSNSTLFTIYNGGINKTLLSLGFNNDNLVAKAYDVSTNFLSIGSTDYSSFSYPLSVLLTYDKNPSGILRLYARNEITNSNDLLGSGTLTLSNGDGGFGSLIFGQDTGSSNYFVHEIGISTSGNIVHSNPNRFFKQTTASSFLDGHGHYFKNNLFNKYKLPEYVDKNTSLWHIGDFRTCSFSADFDRLTKKVGEDYIVHHLNHAGSGYSQVVNLPLPSNILYSGIAYHTQIENDFLRFNLSDVDGGSDGFYSAHQRLHKNLPRGYNFEEKSIYVETIVEQESISDIVWNDGSIGPKLIVSLYTKNQEPIDRPSKYNWGLINRSIHQIEPSACIHKLSTIFNYNDIFDISEPWANFDQELLKTEFNHKYFSKDIDDMFLQYDLVYPSGRPINSMLKIHSSNVKLKNAILKERDLNNTFNLISSGEQYQANTLNINTFGLEKTNNSHNLHTIASSIPTASSVINLHCSGAYLQYNSLNTYCHNIGTTYSNLPLYVGGRYNKFDDQILPLILINTFSQPSSYETFNLFVNNRIPEENKNNVNLTTIGRRQLVNYFPSNNFNLFVVGEPYWRNSQNNFNLYISGSNPISIADISMNLHLTNYLAENQAINQQATLTWNGKP